MRRHLHLGLSEVTWHGEHVSVTKGHQSWCTNKEVAPQNLLFPGGTKHCQCFHLQVWIPRMSHGIYLTSQLTWYTILWETSPVESKWDNQFLCQSIDLQKGTSVTMSLKNDKGKAKERECAVCKTRKTVKRSSFMCVDWNVGLCIVPCFREYHTRWGCSDFRMRNRCYWTVKYDLQWKAVQL